mmetsp:Transcript_26415/g.52631  ORF Transcript_26415/g.52631 Transcript_26415/m.52631 type:complete len:257 (+) Transcript_26415:24-794(+)
MDYFLITHVSITRIVQSTVLGGVGTSCTAVHARSTLFLRGAVKPSFRPRSQTAAPSCRIFRGFRTCGAALGPATSSSARPPHVPRRVVQREWEPPPLRALLCPRRAPATVPGLPRLPCSWRRPVRVRAQVRAERGAPPPPHYRRRHYWRVCSTQRSGEGAAGGPPLCFRPTRPSPASPSVLFPLPTVSVRPPSRPFFSFSRPPGPSGVPPLSPFFRRQRRSVSLARDIGAGPAPGWSRRCRGACGRERGAASGRRE